MHVAFAADSRRIAELARYLFNRGAKVALRLRGAVEAFKLIKGHRRKDSSRPGAEVLCRNILAGDFLEIVVHVSRRDILAIAPFVDVLKQFLSGQLLARFYNLGDAPVPDAQRPLLAALAGEAETHFVSVDGDVPVLKSGQAVAVVLLRRVVVADADKRRLQKMNDGCQNLFARQAAQRHVLLHFLTDARQRVGEGNDMFVLSAFTHLAKAHVIAVLLAALRVAARRLNVAIGERAYPDIRPGRRNCERFDPLQHILFRELGAVGPRVGKSSPRLLAAYARSSVGDVSQTRGLGSVSRVDDRLSAIG